MIELKHSRDYYCSHKTRKDSTIDRWYEMNEQLRDAEASYKQFGEKTKGVIRLGLNFITAVTEKSPTKQLIDSFRGKVKEIQYRLVDDLVGPRKMYRPDMVVCWMIPEKLVKGGEITMPGLWVFVKYFKPLNHKGAKDYFDK